MQTMKEHSAAIFVLFSSVPQSPRKFLYPSYYNKDVIVTFVRQQSFELLYPLGDVPEDIISGVR